MRRADYWPWPVRDALCYAARWKPACVAGNWKQLEWQDMHLDGEKPHLRVRGSTTKNHKPAHPEIDDELADELRKIRPEPFEPKQRVFAGLIPRMKRFRLDLKAAQIAPVDGAGKRVDFHALRMTFQMLLTLNGTQPRVVMELMRHSDMKLTTKTYTDAGLLPTGDAVRKLPSLLQARVEYTPESTPGLVASGLLLSSTGTATGNGEAPQSLINTGLGRQLTPPVAESHGRENGARCRVRTCDPIRVKDVLYR